MKATAYFFLLCFLAPLYSEDPRVLVTVSPYRWVIEELTAHQVPCQEIVPAGSSSHTFEVSPKQALSASRSSLWFTIGEPFEERARKAYLAVNPDLKVVDLRQGIDLIASSCSHSHHKSSVKDGHAHCHHHEKVASQDLHFWLSLKIMEQQVALIAQALKETFPELREGIEERREQLSLRLKAVDQEIQSTLAPYQGRALLVSHPAYSYFCRDYHLEQIPIEWEGKDPSPRQLTDLLNQARQKKIRVVFSQPQYSQKGAELIAKILEAETVSLDPYQGNFIENLLLITHAFKRSF
ncbi:MAG: ABC-type transporter, substrate-binding lipoprotein [Chlamydiales bacterium]|jgi:zinc transport system substrate-binding protein|nr:ABC-type transporter, substrate-binding lipoprotein [Chlamydiales bacterium]